MRVELASLALALACGGACIAPSVVASSGRAVVAPEAQLDWRPAEVGDIAGLFDSTAIDGPVAGALLRVHYDFADDGSYSGAALVQDGALRAYQTLVGRWSLSAPGRLELGEGVEARAEVAPEHLRLTSEAGSVVLRRIEAP